MSEKENPPAETSDGFIADLIAIVTADDLFSEAEARALLRSVSADRPEDLPNNLDRVVSWARNLRSELAILDVVLKLGEHGAIDVRPAPDKGIMLRLKLGPDEIEIRDEK